MIFTPSVATVISTFFVDLVKSRVELAGLLRLLLSRCQQNEAGKSLKWTSVDIIDS